MILRVRPERADDCGQGPESITGLLRAGLRAGAEELPAAPEPHGFEIGSAADRCRASAGRWRSGWPARRAGAGSWRAGPGERGPGAGCRCLPRPRGEGPDWLRLPVAGVSGRSAGPDRPRRGRGAEAAPGPGRLAGSATAQPRRTAPRTFRCRRAVPVHGCPARTRVRERAPRPCLQACGAAMRAARRQGGGHQVAQRAGEVLLTRQDSAVAGVDDMDRAARSRPVRRREGQDLLDQGFPAASLGQAAGVQRPAAHAPIPPDLGDHDPHPASVPPPPARRGVLAPVVPPRVRQQDRPRPGRAPAGGRMSARSIGPGREQAQTPRW